MSTRLLVAGAAVLTLLVPSTALAGVRGLTVKVPKTLTEGQVFTATYTGDTGPGDLSGGGFIVNARILKTKTCPADLSIPKGSNVVEFGLGNIFGAGAISGADRNYASSPGKYVVCGYITKNLDGPITYELLYTGHTTVKKAKHLHFGKLPKMKDGVYVAAAAATTGGNPDASVTFSVVGGNVVSASATGIPTVSCFTGFPTQTPVATAATSTGPLTGVNQVYNTMHAAFNAPGLEDFYVQGGAKSDKTVVGAVTGVSADGSCTGNFAFTATRQK